MIMFLVNAAIGVVISGVGNGSTIVIGGDIDTATIFIPFKTRLRHIVTCTTAPRPYKRINWGAALRRCTGACFFWA